MTTTWRRFTWNLDQVPDGENAVISPYSLRVSKTDEVETFSKTTISAFSMDSGWGDLQGPFLEGIRKQVEAAFSKDAKCRCLALLHGSRIIGTSVLNLENDAEAHLLTGPCILHEYRSRGLGSQLLHASLHELAGEGMKKVHGITKVKTISERFIYPKFGSLSEPWTHGLDFAPKLAA